MRSGIADDFLRVPRQAIVEFVAAVTRSLPGRAALLLPSEAFREAEELLGVMRGGPRLEVVRERSFDNPLFWGAFQLIGRGG